MQPLFQRRELLAATGAVSCLGAWPMLTRAAAGDALTDWQSAELRAVGRSAVASGDIPGVVSVVDYRGELVFADATGLRNREARLPMERSTLFGIASMSKPVTVALALTLLDEGKLELEDSITRWAPEFANTRVLRRADGPLDDTYAAPRDITIQDLMTHRSGLAYGFLTPGPLGRELFARFDLGIASALSPDEWLATLAKLPLAYAPGERFNYGHSIDVLGFVAARVAGTTLQRALHERVLGPLGMSDTCFWVPPLKRARMAQVYASNAPHEFTPTAIKHFVADEPPAYASGGQGLVSTADDYLKFARMLVGDGSLNGVQLLRPETVQRMLTNRLTPAQRELPFLGRPYWRGQGFGLGVSVVTDPAEFPGSAGRGSFGWPGGFGGWWQADPDNGLVLLWLQECVPASPLPTAASQPRIPGALATIEFQKRAYAALVG